MIILQRLPQNSVTPDDFSAMSSAQHLGLRQDYSANTLEFFSYWPNIGKIWKIVGNIGADF
jgi:hypothetical protein